jgi:hypothetical protein
VPGNAATSTPVLLTVETFGLSVVHEMCLSVSTFPSAAFITTDNCWLVPAIADGDGTVRTTVATAGGPVGESLHAAINVTAATSAATDDSDRIARKSIFMLLESEQLMSNSAGELNSQHS